MIEYLVDHCTRPIEDYSRLGDTIDTADGPLTYIDNGADVLAVAHLDYVLARKPRLSRKARRDTGIGTIRCPQLDDRLGVWTILDLLPSMGVKCDILLTDSEEVGKSTARYFDSPKEYNWMFQFDRHGTDCVMYEYETEDGADLLRNNGFIVGVGSFSDICYLTDLGVVGVNFGVGYHHEHTEHCYALLKDTYAQARLFARFWKQYHSMKWEAPPIVEWEYKYSYYKGNPSWDDDPSITYSFDRDTWECICGEVNWDHDHYCDICGVCQDDVSALSRDEREDIRASFWEQLEQMNGGDV